ncbi:putative Spermidine/putrescine transport system permease protein PotC [Streptomyces afghaniensis 772]|uniref:Putative Spermidine/putrescine transport system permease protein PotC n=1 Tax=Streptomyces afghaniensis 772 TaxID=1283301 RepID=S4MQY7_9ACTN|nr:ABC transporter permease subunit [Streptomyces afghaniensis]EPJ41968.1 putative Spermidine/putrescine transport system permease protein PotC [Streptomyces afghaniensis 772]
MMLPYTVLLLYGVMRGVDRRLLAAASSMGAGRVTIFRRVYLPLVPPAWPVPDCSVSSSRWATTSPPR